VTLKPLPVLISIPHGGTEVPRELEGKISTSRGDILEDIDVFTREIYDLGSQVRRVIQTPIARTFVDLNRAPDDRPPANPDGVVKTVTCYGKQIYHQGRQLDGDQVEQLISRYYAPYHRRIRDALSQGGFEIALDCHSMAAIGPAASPDPGMRRPPICLGNAYGKTCGSEAIEKLAECLAQAYGLELGDVAINQPFAGGYITRTYGADPVPWIQVEISRALYLAQPWFNPELWEVAAERLDALRSRFYDPLECFMNNPSFRRG
jgi:formiminoglutamase